jgi:hypothetical protein
MRRISIFALTVLACWNCFGQNKKPSKSSKAVARQELAPAPVAAANAPSIPTHPSPYCSEFWPGVTRATWTFFASGALNWKVTRESASIRGNWTPGRSRATTECGATRAPRRAPDITTS